MVGCDVDLVVVEFGDVDVVVDGDDDVGGVFVVGCEKCVGYVWYW